MHKPHRIPYDAIKVAEVHLVTRFVEAQCKTNGYSRTVPQVSLVVAQRMFKMMGDYIDEFEFQTLVGPYLAKVRWVFALRLGHAVDSVKDCHAGEKSESWRVAACMKVIPRRIDNHFQVS